MKTLFLVLIITGLSDCKESSGLIETNEYGLITSGDSIFQIAILPDSQYYTSIKNGGTMNMFEDQINWIRKNKTAAKIAYVIHLGDVVEDGSTDNEIQWIRAKTQMYKLEEDNIPYGVAVGNHDQTPISFPGEPGTDYGYNVWFGRDHMSTKTWYGGAHRKSNNSDNHYDIFTACGINFIVLYMEYNSPSKSHYSHSIEESVMNWADSVLNVYSNRKAIIVSHGILSKPEGSTSDIRSEKGNNNVASEFAMQGTIIYNRMKVHSNVFLMLCGHISGEGFRRDAYQNNVIKTYLSDFQSRQNPPYEGEKNRNGGNGLMRLMEFNLTNQTISVKTFAPRENGIHIIEEDEDSKFTKALYN